MNNELHNLTHLNKLRFLKFVRQEGGAEFTTQYIPAVNQESHQMVTKCYCPSYQAVQFSAMVLLRHNSLAFMVLWSYGAVAYGLAPI